METDSPIVRVYLEFKNTTNSNHSDCEGYDMGIKMGSAFDAAGAEWQADTYIKGKGKEPHFKCAAYGEAAAEQVQGSKTCRSFI